MTNLGYSSFIRESVPATVEPRLQSVINSLEPNLVSADPRKSTLSHSRLFIHVVQCFVESFV